MQTKNQLSPTDSDTLLKVLEARFLKNIHRHPVVDWVTVSERLRKNPEKLWSLNEMERTGGEPDVTGVEPATGAIIYCDCSLQSPSGRRSLCYDRKALESRRQNKPLNSALDMAEAMGIEVLTEAQYRELQTLGSFDTTTSSWIITPEEVRKSGGALFGDFR
ncbi:MAG TPA: DUF4256 domain-containing protein, partial [Bacteroidales bacterium]|nr:DUF4256 domain-containing protein [Bacteroidales bacterium]